MNYGDDYNSSGYETDALLGLDDEIEEHETIYKLYKRRWFILFLFAFGAMNVTIVHITFPALQDQVILFYGVSAYEVDLMAISSILLCSLTMFFASYIMEKFGIKNCVFIGSSLLLLSVWIRSIAQYLPLSRRNIFWITFAGHFIIGGSQAFLGLANISLMVNNWFGKQERTIATTIATLSSLVALIIVFSAGPFIIQATKNFKILLLSEAILATISSLMCFIFYKSNPPTPPSSTAGENISTMQNFTTNVYNSLTNGHFLILFIAYSIGFGCFHSILILLNQILSAEKYSTEQIGIMGTIMIITSIIGALTTGFIVDKTKRYKIIIKIISICAVISMYLFNLTLKPNNLAIMCITIAFMGFMLVSFIPICMEIAVEVTYPVPAGTPAGLMNFLGNILSVTIILSMDALKDPDPPHNMSKSLFLNIMLYSISLFCVLVFNGRMKRLEKEIFERME